ncbi:zinc ribbon domain-containing protein [Chloroflexota bacterium]|nr:zinc ribbon domain-containing protein [Chloroflexota bacterium]
MPIYEYRCQDCTHTFELIRSIKDADANLSCPHCQSEQIKRQLSLFNASSGGQSLTSGGGCSGCSGGSCSSCGG